jgi:hypothetical protein
VEQLEADVAALAAMDRSSAAGERDSARWIAERLDGRVEPFRYQGTYGWAHALHLLAGLVAPLPALVSLELEASGRLQWIRRLLPAGEGANVIAERGDGPRTVVVIAHHDTARTGLVWHPRVVALGAARNLKRRRIDGYEQPLALGFLLAAHPHTRWLGRALLLLGAALQIDVARGASVPGANDNATGVAALLALADDPPPGARLLLVAPGCEESGMGGMAAFLREHGGRLDPAATLFLSLDTLGCGTPIVLSGEGTILERRYAEEDLALAEAAAARAGLQPPQRWRIGGWTDPILARLKGFRAISLLSMGPGHFTHYHHPTDTPEHVDFDCVRDCLTLARAIVAEWADPPRPRPVSSEGTLTGRAR